MSAEAMEEEGGGEGQPESKRFAGKKLVLFIILPVLIVIGAIAGVFFSGILSKKEAPKQDEHAAAEEPAPKQTAPKQTVFFAVVVALSVGLFVHFFVDFKGARLVYGLAAAVHAWIELPVLLTGFATLTGTGPRRS